MMRTGQFQVTRVEIVDAVAFCCGRTVVGRVGAVAMAVSGVMVGMWECVNAWMPFMRVLPPGLVGLPLGGVLAGLAVWWGVRFWPRMGTGWWVVSADEGGMEMASMGRRVRVLWTEVREIWNTGEAVVVVGGSGMVVIPLRGLGEGGEGVLRGLCQGPVGGVGGFPVQEKGAGAS